MSCDCRRMHDISRKEKKGRDVGGKKERRPKPEAQRGRGESRGRGGGGNIAAAKFGILSTSNHARCSFVCQKGPSRPPKEERTKDILAGGRDRNRLAEKQKDCRVCTVKAGKYLCVAGKKIWLFLASVRKI